MKTDLIKSKIALNKAKIQRAQVELEELENELLEAKHEPMTGAEFVEYYGISDVDFHHIKHLNKTVIKQVITAYDAAVKNTHLIYDELVSIAERYIDDRNHGWLKNPGEYAEKIIISLEKIKRYRSAE